MQFSKIIGQDAVKQRLINTVKEQRIPHAQLFIGPSGVGKLQLAIAYAQYIACPNRSDSDSCGQCPSCVQFQKLQHPDLHFAFPVLKTETSTPISDDYINEFRSLLIEQQYFDENDWFNAIGADKKVCYIYEKESQEIIKKLSLKSYSAEFKAMIIWLPERMYEDIGANKLLKLLEEPPEKTLFILVCEKPEKLLPTIISRTQQIRIPRLTEQEIIGGLKTIDDSIDNATATDLAHIADGSFLRAKQLLAENTQNTLFLNQFIELMRNAYRVGVRRDYAALQNMKAWSDSISDKSIGRETRLYFLQYCLRMIRENYVMNLNDSSINYMTSAEKEFSKNFARFINENIIEDIINELSLAHRQIEQNGNAKIIFFDLCLKMIVFIKRNS